MGSAIINADTDPQNIPDCKFVYIVPVRYALTSERSEKIPLQKEYRGKKFLVPPQKNLDYTLRLLREGFLHVYYPSNPDSEPKGKSRLSWAVSEKGMFTQLLPGLDGTMITVGEEQSFIKLPKPKSAPNAVYMAFSDMCWGEAAWKRAENEARGASDGPHRLHKIYLDQETQEAADDNSGTYCRKALEHDIAYVDNIQNRTEDFKDLLCLQVEEYRLDPGFLCAIHEYNETSMHQLFEPEYMHFPPKYRDGRMGASSGPKPEILDKSYFPDETQVKKRWRRTAHKFQWQRSGESTFSREAFDLPGGPNLRDLRGYLCTPRPFFVALADPVGIAMDCASIHNNSLLALRDLTRWYGEVQLLAAQTIACDNRVFTGQFRQPGYAPLPPAQELLKCMKEDIPKVSVHFKTLITFWIAWLTSKENFSLLGALKDFEGEKGLEGQKESDLIEHERILSECIAGLTSHGIGVELAWEALESLDKAFSKHLVQTFENSPWAKKEGSLEKKEETFLPEILSSLTGLLTAQGAVAKKFEGGLNRKLHDISLDILTRKLSAAKAADPASADFSVPEDEAYRLSLLSAKNPAEMEKSFPLRSGGSITVPWSTDMHIRCLAQDQDTFPKFKWFTHVLAFGKTGMKTGGNFSAITASFAWLGLLNPAVATGGPAEPSLWKNLTDASKKFATPAFYWMRVYGTCDALTKITTQSNTPLGNTRNFCDLMVNSLGIAEIILANSTSTLVTRSSVYQSLLPMFRSKASRVITSMFPISRNYLQLLVGRSIIAFAVGKAAIDAWEASQNGEDLVWGGNVAILSGCLFMLAFPAFSPFGAVIAGIGALVAIFGKTERLHYRAQKSFFKMNMPEVDSGGRDNHWKVYRTASMASLSYAGKYLPPHALDHEDFAGSDIYDKRISKIRRDMDMLMLMSCDVVFECYYDKTEGALALILTPSNVTEQSTMKIKTVKIIRSDMEINYYHFNGLPADFVPETVRTIEFDLTEQALNSAWGCCFNSGMSSWYTAFEYQLEGYKETSDRHPAFGIETSFQKWQVTAEVEFFYRDNMDEAYQELEKEEKEYKYDKDNSYKIIKYKNSDGALVKELSPNTTIKGMIHFPF